MPDDLLGRLRSLNPVPDPDRLVTFGDVDWPADPVLRTVLEQARESDHDPRPWRPGPERPAESEETVMPTLSRDRSNVDRRAAPPPRRGWLAAAAVAVLTVIGVFAVLQAQPRGEGSAQFVTDPARDPEAARVAEAVALAEAYLDAGNAHDSDRARELVAEDFRTNEYPEGHRDRATMEMAFEQHQAWGFHYADVDCTPRQETSDRVVVRCDYLWMTELQRVGNHEPTSTYLTVHVEDGRITETRRGFGDSRSWWDPFIRFLLREDPEFRQVVDRSLDLDPAAHQEVLERLPDFLERYADWVGSQEG
jgi:ketosteroid isomerase-like protein